MRITSKGQVTIPLPIRRAASLLPNCEVEFKVVGDRVILTKAAKQPLRGKRLIEQMRGRGDIKMSTDEIMTLTRGDR
jgi:bifunctional DNA-binding transcriptional regulator/antitoxin component of YhaV-PrlF toxin-antitoxin module